MAHGCCDNFVKFLLFTFNLFVWIAGAAVLGVGIYLRVGGNIEAVVVIGDLNLYYSGCYIMIAAGSAMFLLGFLGCCGAMTENKCALGLFSIFLFILFVAEVGCAIWAAVNVDQIDSYIEKAFNDTNLNGTDPNDAESQSLIEVEKDLKCCGLTKGCSDWPDSVAYGCDCDPTKGNKSCVKASSLNCTSSTGKEYIYAESCYDEVVQVVEDNVWIVIGIGFGIGFAELIGIAFAIMVCRSKNNYDGLYA